MKHLILILSLIFGPAILRAEDQQPFPTTSFAFHFGYSSQQHHALAEADVARKMGAPVKGFQTFMYNAYQASGVKGSAGQLQVEALGGVAEVRQYKEYVYFGPIVAAGVARDAQATGMAGKFAGVLGYRFGKSQKIAAEGIVSADYSGLNTPTAQKLSRFTFTAFGGVRIGL